MISIILVIYKPKEKLFKKFLEKIPNKDRLILVNIDHFNLKKFNLPKKIKIINTKNKGYGAAINLALSRCVTKYAFISQIDVNYKKNFFKKFYDFSKRIKNFSILIPNEKKKSTQNIISENIDGEASTMLIDVKKIKKIRFDENIFLYFEETDLFFRCKKKNYKVLDVNNFKIFKKRASSISYKNNKIENIMKWHYMWSMFYFYRKNYNYFFALKKTYIYLFKDCIKLFIYLILLDRYNFQIRFYRIYGLLTSIMGIKSFKRP